MTPFQNMQDDGFKQSQSDPEIFYKSEREDLVVNKDDPDFIRFKSSCHWERYDSEKHDRPTEN